MYRNDIYPANVADRHSKKLKQTYIWLCLMMVVVFTILKLFTGSMDVFFEVPDSTTCRPETTVWDKSSITLVGGTMMIAYNFSHWIRVMLTLAYLIDDVINTSHGTTPDTATILYVTVGGACLFEVLALWVSGKMTW
jgi:hypothetical protein